MLTFSSITQHEAGIIASLLLKSYAKILTTESRYWLQEKEKWLQYDLDVFQNPMTIGRCVFITSWNDQPIGFGSYDPRKQHSRPSR